ncbi:hypothetical protein CPB86DRAFT_868768 [Serendipita vermifera]|nr:hypothetical protein CPB86DRAFT_868768 [Serendipita vermifera]
MSQIDNQNAGRNGQAANESATRQDSELSAPTIILIALITLPFILLFRILGSVLRYGFAGGIYQVTGHLVLRLYGAKGFEFSLWDSLKLGALGGAIIALPWSGITALVEKCFESPTPNNTSEEEGTRPLLSSDPAPGYDGATNDTAASSAGQNRPTASAFLLRFSFALILIMMFSPAFGATSGAVGSWVLRRAGKPALDTWTAAATGALGGLGPLLFIGVFLLIPLAIAACATRSSR